jgi:hypothetical protein
MNVECLCFDRTHSPKNKNPPVLKVLWDEFTLLKLYLASRFCCLSVYFVCVRSVRQTEIADVNVRGTIHKCIRRSRAALHKFDFP